MALALIVFLPAAWIAKLALAETLRRPETTLLPFRSRRFLRSGVAFGLFGIALIVEAPWVVGSLWAMSLPATWCVLMLLDRLGDARLARRQVDELVDEGVERASWRTFPAIATGGVLTFVSVAVLVQRAGG